MNKTRRHELLWLIMPAIVGCYLLFSLLHYGFSPTEGNPGFSLLGPNRVPAFYDLKWVLSFSACKGNLRELLMTNTSCFGYSNPYYPALSMELGRWFSLGPRDSQWLGILSGVGAMAVLAHACWLCTTTIRTWSITISLLWLSFPFQILIERSNLDSIIFLLIALFCLVIWLQGAWSILFANTLAGLTIGLKIYPAIAVIAWLLCTTRAPMNKKRKRWLAFSLSLTLVISLLLTYLSIYSSTNLAVEGGLKSHGLTAIGYANTFLLREFGPLLGKVLIRALFVGKALSLVFGLICGLAAARNLGWPENRYHLAVANPLAFTYIQTLVLLTSAVGIGCYIVSIGYDYRFVFLFPLLALVCSNLLDNSCRQAKDKFFLALIIGASAYVFALPFASAADPKAIRYLEMIDEILLAPLVFSGLGGIWIKLFNRLPMGALQPPLVKVTGATQADRADD